MSERFDISSLLSDMRNLRAQTHSIQGLQGDRPDAIGSVKGPSNSFGEMLKSALNQVNSTQQSSSALSEAYIKGDSEVDITQVMVASQKSSLAFQATVQVRNKLVEAYKDVMNMPV